jgi:hypothetical protein
MSYMAPMRIACGSAGSRRLLPVHRYGDPPQGCGNMARMEASDAVVDEIMATAFGVPVAEVTPRRLDCEGLTVEPNGATLCARKRNSSS